MMLLVTFFYTSEDLKFNLPQNLAQKKMKIKSKSDYTLKKSPKRPPKYCATSFILTIRLKCFHLLKRKICMVTKGRPRGNTKFTIMKKFSCFYKQ